MDNYTIQHYLNNFRRVFTKFLKQNIGMKISIYQYLEGVILKFEFAEDLTNTDEYLPKYNTVEEILDSVEIPGMYIKNSKGLKFHGTNIFTSESQIVLIKDLNNSEWDIEKLNNDIKTILNPMQKS